MRLRHVMEAVEQDVEQRQLNEVFDPKAYDLSSSFGNSKDSEESSSDEEHGKDDKETVLWYQFNTLSFTVRVWDCFFALNICVNIILTPLTLVFPEVFHESEDNFDWLTFELFYNFFWLIDFYINLNRVDFLRKKITLRDTAYAYLCGTMIPDGIAILGSVGFCLAGEYVISKYFDMIRLI